MVITRPSIDTVMMQVARVMSYRSTCARRRVGCVLVNDMNHVVATGYNGVAAGQPHCIEKNCPGAQAPSGQGLDMCEAIHAEANALLQCGNVYDISAAYCTTAPCVHCVKLLMNTGCMNIYFKEDYPHSKQSKSLWLTNPTRTWTQLA